MSCFSSKSLFYLQLFHLKFENHLFVYIFFLIPIHSVLTKMRLFSRLFYFVLLLHFEVSWCTLFEFRYLISMYYLIAYIILTYVEHAYMCVGHVCGIGDTERCTAEGTASISAIIVYEVRRSELQDITFFIKAPTVLLCKLKVERFQLMWLWGLLILTAVSSIDRKC